MEEKSKLPSGLVIEPARFPGRAPIDAYGNGGFRFADMSHRGSILVLPSGISAWPVESPEEIAVANLAPLFAEADDIEMVLIGCGQTFTPIQSEAKHAFSESGLGCDLMSTGAAVRTFNVLLSENRAVAAALIAVDNPRGR